MMKLIGFALTAFAFLACGPSMPGSDSHALLNQVAAPIEGRRVEPGFIGANVTVPAPGKVTVVDFWATWCEPCWKEVIPHLETIWRKVDRNRVAIIGVAIDHGDENADQTVREYLTGKVPGGATFPQVFDGKKARLQGLYQVTTQVPATFVIDQQGRVRFFFDNSTGDAKRLEQALDLLVGQ